MAFRTVTDLGTDVTVSLGGYNKKAKKENPTEAEGYFLGTRKTANKLAASGIGYLHVLQTPKGNIGIWGKTDLDRKMGDVKPGTMVRITFTGTVPTNKGSDMLKYKVEFDPTNTIDVTELQAGSGDIGNEVSNVEESEESYDNEDSDAEAAQLAAERQAKVQELLNRGKVNNSRK